MGSTLELRRLRAPMSIAISCVAVAAQSQTDVAPIELETVVVTATRTPQRVSDLVSDVSVVTREQIEQKDDASLVEILQGEPGVQIATNGGRGTLASVFLRGTNPEHVLVLIDGLRFSSATAGTTALQHVAPSHIERIEIVRGPMSSLYGADAIGGVIQILTHAPEDAPQLHGAVGYGSYRTQQYSARYGGRTGGTLFNASVDHLASESFSTTLPGNFNFEPDRDPYRNTSVSARFAQRFSPDHEIGATWFSSTSRLHVDVFEAVDPTQDQTLQAYGAFSRDRFLPWWQSTLRIGRGVDDLTTTSSITSVFETVQDQVSWLNEFKTPVGELLLAGEYLEQRVQGTTDFPVKARTIRSIVGAYTHRRDRHVLQASARLDDNTQFGNETTGALGYGYALGRGWRLSAAYGTAFRAPSFNELYFPAIGDFPAFGNPDLAPESSRSVEAALRYDQGARSGGIVAYRNRVRNLIVGAGPIDAQRAENVEVAQITGITLTYGAALGAWTARASADFLDPKNETKDKLLARRAKHHGALSVTYAVATWSSGFDIVAAGPRFDDAVNTIRLGGYAIVSLSAAYRLGRAWSAFARVDNLFDKQYELADNFATAGFNAFIGVRYGGEAEPRPHYDK